jgi:hypothetical protein
MPKHHFSALFLIIPVSLSLMVFAQRVTDVQHTPFNNNIEHFDAVLMDSIPVEKKSSDSVVPTTVRQPQVTVDSVSRPGLSPKNYDPIKFKGNNVDTTGFIYDLNAFYHLGK